LYTIVVFENLLFSFGMSEHLTELFFFVEIEVFCQGKCCCLMHRPHLFVQWNYDHVTVNVWFVETLPQSKNSLIMNGFVMLQPQTKLWCTKSYLMSSVSLPRLIVFVIFNLNSTIITFLNVLFIQDYKQKVVDMNLPHLLLDVRDPIQYAICALPNSISMSQTTMKKFQINLVDSWIDVVMIEQIFHYENWNIVLTN
jgi:hypothetical protein